MRVLSFETATVVVWPDQVLSAFPDGEVRTLRVEHLDSPEYREVARFLGYGDDWRRYAIEHDIAHHFVSDALARPSVAIREGDGAVPIDQAPEPIKYEEHLVNRLQLLARTGEGDPWGQLEELFPAPAEAVRAVGDLWGEPELSPGDKVRTGSNCTPTFDVIAVCGGRVWIRDDRTGVDGVVAVERLRQVG